MAEINLLPGAVRAKRRGLLRRMAMSLVVCLFVGAGFSVGAEKYVSSLMEQAEAVEKEVDHMRVSLENARVKDEERTLNEKEAAILSAMVVERSRWAERLRGLDDAFPEGQLRLTAILMETSHSGGALLLAGESSSLRAVGDFMDKLKRLTGFTEVMLLDGTYGHKGEVRFQIMCRLPVNLSLAEFASPSDEGR
ncbi:hypothetical protein GTO91_01930 [Heliobacterium undosum]|uniref:Uncharacterized protein n=1 Tax=Heliomicrobium undosum TaxID=121734 RepID=A0A845KYD5_9FIRM|nr:hypothetical protein [Heliomicrobium undosum]MZP28483.1 hypothetical protein [Heliomicrobium undosum]